MHFFCNHCFFKNTTGTAGLPKTVAKLVTASRLMILISLICNTIMIKQDCGKQNIGWNENENSSGCR